jgi:WD40 repeat protein
MTIRKIFLCLFFLIEVAYSQTIKLEENEKGVESIRFYHENYLISGNYDKTIKIWDWQQNKVVFTSKKQKGYGVYVDIDNDKNLMASTSKLEIKIWDLQKKEVINQWLTSKKSSKYDYIEKLKFIPENDMLISIAWNDSVINIWNYKTAEKLYTLKIPNGKISDFEICKQGNLLVGVGEKVSSVPQFSEPVLIIWELKNMEKYQEYTPKGFYSHLTSNFEGNLIALWGLRKTEIFDVTIGKEVLVFENHTFGDISVMSFLDSNKHFSVGNMNGRLFILDLPKAMQIYSNNEDVKIEDIVFKTSKVHDGTINCILTESSYKMLATCGMDGIINIWKK